MSLEQAKPYIGVSGIPRTETVAHQMSVIFTETTRPRSHVFMAGYLINERFAYGIPPRSNRLHTLDSLPQALSQTHDLAFNTVHYYTQHPDLLAGQINDLFTQTGIYEDGLVDGLQINRTLPPPEELTKIKTEYPNLRLVLQFRLEDFGKSDVDLKKYEDTVSYILLDKSRGRGKNLNTIETTKIGNRLARMYPQTSIIYAGGITPDNVQAAIREITRHTGDKNFGIDAQTGLTTQSSTQNNVFDVEKAKRYLENAATAFNE